MDTVRQFIFGTLVMALLLINSFGYAMGEEEDPEGATPTDDSIAMIIDSVDYRITAQSLTEFTIIFNVKGTTSTDNDSKAIHHIGTSLFTLYYKNGTMDNGEVVEYGPEGIDYSDEDMKFQIIKKADNWTEWEIVYEMKFVVSIDEQGNITVIMSDLDVAKIFVRAYSDEEGNNWTQASSDITDEYKNAWIGLIAGILIDDEDSPGFGVAGLLVAVGCAFLLQRKYGIEK